MNFLLYENRLELVPNVPVPLHAGRGLRITCCAGAVWLTVAGELDDVFLLAGQSHDVHGRGLVLLEGLGNARVTVKPLQPRLLARLRRWQCPRFGRMWRATMAGNA